MLDRRSILAICAATLMAVSSSALADPTPRPFEQKAFDASVASGKPVVVQISAPWCPICRAQKPILAKLLEEPRFKDLELYEIDFDNDKASMQAVKARLQSTLILYKSGKEVARTVGDRELGWVEELLEKAL